MDYKQEDYVTLAIRAEWLSVDKYSLSLWQNLHNQYLHISVR